MDNQLIYELLKEMRDEQRSLSQSINKQTIKFNDHLISDQIMSDDIAFVKIEIERNNNILEKLTETVIQHENRSTTLEKIVIGTDSQPGLVPRVVKLEEPGKIKEFLMKKYTKWATAIGVTISIAGGLAKIFGWW